MPKMLFIAALALLPVSAHAECNDYVGRHYPYIRLHEEKMKLTVSYDQWAVSMDKVILKPFGVLIDGGVEMGELSQPTHSIVRDKIDGETVIIVDSIIFVPSCK
jgi:hypothetical protein